MRASFVFLIAIMLGSLTTAGDMPKPSAERGGQAVRTLPLNPPVLPDSTPAKEFICARKKS